MSHSLETLWSPTGSFVHGISQAKILEWFVMSFSGGFSQLREWTCISYSAGWSLQCFRLNIACFLYGHNCLFLFVIYPRYLTHCIEICCAFENLCSPPKIKDLSGILIWDLHGEVHIISCTYSRIAHSYRCVSHSCFPGAWGNQCVLPWKP